jgi:CHASE3 domain sensor protein
MVNFIKKHKQKILNIFTVGVLVYFYISSAYNIYLVWVNGSDQHTIHRQIAVLLGTLPLLAQAKDSKNKFLILDYLLSFIFNLVFLVVILVKR